MLVESPKFFCAFLETLTDLANALIHTLILIPEYGDIYKVPKTGTGLSQNLDSLTNIDFYIDYFITSLQGGTEQQG